MMKNKKRRLLLLGLGDLGSRIAQIIAERGMANALKLASRGASAGDLVQRLRRSTDCEVSGEKVDGLDLAGLTRLMADFEPDLIIQSASLFSPWAVPECETPSARGRVTARFAPHVFPAIP